MSQSPKLVYEGKDLESMANAKNYYRWMIQEFKPYIKGVVVEVGAGSGTFSEYLLSCRPDKFYALEPSAEMAPKLKKKLAPYPNATAVKGYLGDQLGSLKGKADSLFYINVLEHIEDDDQELRQIFETLKPGGHLCVYVPALQAIYGSFDKQVGHFRRYSKKQLRQKLTAAGFEIKRLNYSDIIGIVPWWINFRLLKSEKLGGGSVSIYDKLVVPLIKTQEKLIKPPIGKNLWAVARKPD